MYKCNSCEKTFERPNTVVGSGDYWNLCPYCDSDNYIKIETPKENSLEERVAICEKEIKELNKCIKNSPKINSTK